MVTHVVATLLLQTAFVPVLRTGYALVLYKANV